MGGIVPRRVHVDIHQGCFVRRAQERPTLGPATFSSNYHEWITETKVTMKENLILEAPHYDIEVSCPLQWGLLWFSAPKNLNRKFVNNGTKVAKFRDTVPATSPSMGLTPQGSVYYGR